MSWNAWFDRMAAALAAPRLRQIGPLELRSRVIASLPLKAARRLRPGLAAGWLQGAPAVSELRLFGLKATYPIAAARAGLNWQPRIALEEGLAGCVQWLAQR